MSEESKILIHHSITNILGAEMENELKARLEASLPSSVDILVATTPAQSKRRISTVEIVLTIRPLGDLLDEATELQWIQSLNAGIDSYDFERIGQRDILVTTASGVASDPIAEQVLGYLLVFERKIHRGIRQQIDHGVWQSYTGGELGEKTICIVGIGTIGTRIAELASAFDMVVIGTKRDTETVPEAVDEVHPPDGIHQALTEADYVVLSCPLNEETRGLIGTEEFMAMPSSGVLVNVARGEIVDEDALETSLQEGIIKGAALDVFQQEPLPPESVLWDLPNAIVTPHMAGTTPRYVERAAALFSDNFHRYTDDNYCEIVNRVI
jgi:phosphoglycerate dehydrogenase-like enzyme